MSDISRDKLLEIYQIMATVRAFEVRALQEVRGRGSSVGGMHSSVGQEAVPGGIGANLTKKDYLGSNHRGHGHCIAKGVDPKLMMAELFGRVGGSNKGKGGSMHIADLSMGMLGANGIVGASCPMAVGAALKIRYRGEDGVAVAFFGDGASNQGNVHESMNLAAVWKLPVLFVCENNHYAESTPVSYTWAVDSIAKRADGYGMPGVAVDGMDVFEVYNTAKGLIDMSRAGGGPAFLECKTYRFQGHFSGDDAHLYRTEEEEKEWMKRDPLDQFRNKVLKEELLTEVDMSKIDKSVDDLMDEAVSYADGSPLPSVDELLTDVYLSYPREELVRGTGLLLK
jgi:TPP-dependent pyruvate/acetoin dehydrogenase alpha subunit